MEAPLIRRPTDVVAAKENEPSLKINEKVRKTTAPKSALKAPTSLKAPEAKKAAPKPPVEAKKETARKSVTTTRPASARTTATATSKPSAEGSMTARGTRVESSVVLRAKTGLKTTTATTTTATKAAPGTSKRDVFLEMKKKLESKTKECEQALLEAKAGTKDRDAMEHRHAEAALASRSSHEGQFNAI